MGTMNEKILFFSLFMKVKSLFDKTHKTSARHEITQNNKQNRVIMSKFAKASCFSFQNII
jgi:hypothetical protein